MAAHTRAHAHAHSHAPRDTRTHTHSRAHAHPHARTSARYVHARSLARRPEINFRNNTEALREAIAQDVKATDELLDTPDFQAVLKAHEAFLLQGI